MSLKVFESIEFPEKHDFSEAEKTGTTIMAVKYNNGVIVGADCRTSKGSYVMSRTTDKLHQISDKIFCCVSGSSADTQNIFDVVKKETIKMSYQENTIPSVKKAAVIASSIIYNNPKLCAGLIIAGYDTEPRIFNVTLGGFMKDCDWCIGGSGSGYIYGYCDMNYKSNMELKEALEFVKKSVFCAIKRDNASGGSIRMVDISKDGTCRYFYSGEKILSE